MTASTCRLLSKPILGQLEPMKPPATPEIELLISLFILQVGIFGITLRPALSTSRAGVNVPIS